MRVFLDTNVLVSAFTTRGLCADALHAVLAEHQLVLGESVLSELRRVLLRKFGASQALVDEAEAFLRREAAIASTPAELALTLSDQDDVPILGEALAVEADVFVTGDAALLRLGSKSPLPTLSPRAFWDQLRSPQ